MNKLLCPYCQTDVDEHEAVECGDDWLAKLLGWETGSDDDRAEWVRCPPFMASLAAQKLHVWPVIMGRLDDFEDDDFEDDDFGIFYAPITKTWVMEIPNSPYGEDKARPSLASWRACIKYLATKEFDNDAK